MIVARQFIAWYPRENGNRPVGHGMIGSDRRAMIRTTNQPWVTNHSVPYGTGSVLPRFPGNKLPGYDHLVPTGHGFEDSDSTELAEVLSDVVSAFIGWQFCERAKSEERSA